MRKLLFLVLILAVACSTTSSSQKHKEADVHYQLGLSYMKEGQYQDAFVEFQKSIDIYPDDRRVLNALGLIYMKFEELDKSEEVFKEALDIDPEFSEAANNLGVVYSRKKDWKSAIIYFERALQNPLYPSPERAFYNLATAHYRLHDFMMALKYFKDALRRAPKFFPAYYGMALCYNALEDYGEASTALTMGIEIDPEIEGKKQKAAKVFNSRMVLSVDNEEREDYRSLIEILHY